MAKKLAWEEFLQAWREMTEEEQEALLPKLISVVPSYQYWVAEALDTRYAYFWLTRLFRTAGVPMCVKSDKVVSAAAVE